MARPPAPPGPELLTPEETGRLFGVDAKTVARWDKAGKFPDGTVIRTLGGHRRFRGDYVRPMLTRGAK